MARERSLKISKINIVTHPHKPETYVELLRTVFRFGKSIPIRGDQHLMIGELRYLDAEAPLKGLFGRLYRFVQIDKDAPWFNVAKNDIATEEEVAQINIPDYLRPNCQMFDFVFYPESHSFFLESKSGPLSLSPLSATKMLQSLFASPLVKENFGDVEVHIFADKEQLASILTIHELRRLIIEVTKPNPDDLASAQRQVFGRLNAMKARRLKVEITAESHESIEVSEDLKLAAEVAAAGNGRVVGSGYTRRGQRIEESTQDKPWESIITFNPDLQTQTDAIVAATANLQGNT